MNRNEQTLTHGELCHLIDLSLLEVKPESPLNAVLKAGPQGSARELGERGLMTDDWKQALAVLCSPDFEARSLLAFPEQTAVNVLYADRSQGEMLVACREEGERVCIEFPVEPDAVAKADCDALGGTHGWPPDSGEIVLSVDAFSTLAAAADVVRATLLLSILNRAPAAEGALRRDDLDAVLQLGIEHGDARWIVTLLRTLAPPGCKPETAHLERGYGELVESGFITQAGDGEWLPSPTLQRLATYWKLPLPASAHEAVVLCADGSQERRARVTIRGDGPLWTADYEGLDGDAPGVKLRSVDGDVWFMEVLEMVTPPPPEAPIPAVSAPVSAPAPAPVSEPSGTCASCGAALQAPAKFCPACGTPVSRPAEPPPVPAAPPPPPPPSACASCGAALRPGAAFCRRCGTAVR